MAAYIHIEVDDHLWVYDLITTDGGVGGLSGAMGGLNVGGGGDIPDIDDIPDMDDVVEDEDEATATTTKKSHPSGVVDSRFVEFSCRVLRID